MTNISSSTQPEEQLAEIFRMLAQPVRIQILQVIGNGECCVCHLEAYLGHRQAAISQHLMALRDAGLVVTLREGRNIYYRLVDPNLLNIIQSAAAIKGLPENQPADRFQNPMTPCPCPKCNPTNQEQEKVC